MAYYDDLSPYSYHSTKVSNNVLNVGWLSSLEEFNKGEVTEEFIHALKVMLEQPVNLFRGLHHCEFCPSPIFTKKDNKFVPEITRDCPSGNGEIRVNGNNGIIYVAPTLIMHYIEEHNYKPPEEFINAIMQTTT